MKAFNMKQTKKIKIFGAVAMQFKSFGQSQNLNDSSLFVMTQARLSLKMLMKFADQHKSPSSSIAGLEESRKFLAENLPARCQEFRRFLFDSNSMRSFNGQQRAVPEFLLKLDAMQKLSHHLLEANEAKRFFDSKSFSEFDESISKLRKHVDADFNAVSEQIQQKRRSDSSFSAFYKSDVNYLMNELFQRVFVFRLFVDEHVRFRHNAHIMAPSSQANNNFDGASVFSNERNNDFQPCPIGLINIRTLVEDTVEQLKSFAIEKNGACPEILIEDCWSSQAPKISSPLFATSEKESINDELPTTILAHPAHLHFMLIELLKNSVRAVLDRYGVLQAYQAPPIVLTLGVVKKHLVVRVSDRGGGILLPSSSSISSTSIASSPIFDYFYSSAPPQLLTYTYSRQFGAPFTGLGVGLPLARFYARFAYGGDLCLQSVPNWGTDAYLTLDRLGHTLF